MSEPDVPRDSPTPSMGTPPPRSPTSPRSEVAPSSPAPVDGKSFMSRAGDDTDVPDDADQKPNRREKKSKDKEGGAHVGKIRHLKKDDGEPLWRVDIQHDFLKAVFDDEKPVFTNSYDPTLPKQNFADLYIDTMSRSSKTSKVLRDKLMSDREAAKGMAMVCLLVNMGRMNTTLNFFPEMRAQLRTYHAIPSLQAHQDPHAYKQLQDAPRLKSILKGGAEDRDEPTSLDKIKQRDVPRTNPVNLIFVMCSAALKIAELHFPKRHEFHDLIMKKEMTSFSRARAFLWLMWFHLESDFTEEGCDENPFGQGVDYNLGVANQGIPELLSVNPDDEPENVDSPEEVEYGLDKKKTRAKILEMDQAYLNERENRRGKTRVPAQDDGPAILPRIRPSKHESDIDSTRSTPPPKATTKAQGASSRRGAPLKYQIYEGSSPARPGNEGIVARKPRPPTAHQLAVERNRHERVEYILDRGLRKQHRKSRRIRKQDGAIFRAYKRVKEDAGTLEDSEGEEFSNLWPGPDGDKPKFREKGIGGLRVMVENPDDFGEEVAAYAAALRRATRRLARWEGRADTSVVKPIKKPSVAVDKEAEPEDRNGDMTIPLDEDIEMEEADQTAVLGDDERADDDRTEVLGDSDVEVA